MTSNRNLLGISILVLTLIGLSTGASAFTVTWETPVSGTVISGSSVLNISVSSGANVNETIFYHNTSSSFQQIGTDTNQTQSDKTYWNVTFDTTSVNDGALRLSANATNITFEERYATLDVTVDNTGPTFDIELPETGANLTTSTEFLNITNVSDEHSPIGSAQFAFSNGTGNYTSSGTTGWGSLTLFDSKAEFNTSVSADGLKDGTYDVWFNVSDGNANVRYKQVQTVYVDYDGPSTTFNSNANEVDADVTDSPWSVDGDSAVFTIKNSSSGTTYNGTGDSSGINTSLQQSGNTFTYDLNTSDFTAYNYTVIVWANDTNNNTGQAQTHLYIDNATATVENHTIDDTSTGDSITTATTFNLDLDYADRGFTSGGSLNSGVGVQSCSVDVYEEANWSITDNLPAGDPVVSENFTLNSGAASTSIDLSGLEGNITFRAGCTDFAGNGPEVTRTLTMSDNTETQWFPVDDAAPAVDSSSVQPANDSFTNESQPSISFDITDFAGVSNSSIQVWFNDTGLTTSNYSTSSSNGNSTITVSYTPDQLQEQEYNITVNATDVRGKIMGNVSYSFTVDTTAPTIDDISTNDGQDVDGTTWYSGNIRYDVTCSDSSSGMDTYELTRNGGNDIGNGESSTGTGTQNLTFDVDNSIEGSVDLAFSCIDTAGNTVTNTSFTGINIDTAGPTVSTRRPISDRSLSTVPYDQTVTVQVSDGGAGFSSSLSESDLNLDPTFDGNSVSSYDVTIDSTNNDITISWTQSDVGSGTHDISLDNGGQWTVDDAVNNDLDVEAWSYEVSESTTQTQQTTSTSASLDITNMPDSITMVPGRQRTVDLNVENSGDSSASTDASVSVDSTDLDATISPSSFDLASGDTRGLDLDLDAADAFSGSAEVTLEISYGGNTETATLTVEANPGDPALSITNAPEEIDIWDNGTATSIAVTVENTGSARAKGLEPTISGFTINSSDPETLSISAGGSAEMSIEVSNSDRDVGTHSSTLRLSNDDQTISQSLTVKVQPSEDETRQNITTSISDLKSQIEEVSNTTEREQLQQLVSDAESSIADEDYAEAASLRDKIKDRLQKAQSQNKSGSGLPIIPLLAVIGITALALGALAYIFLIRPEETQQEDAGGNASVEFGQSGSRIEHIGKSILATTGALIDTIEQAISTIIDSITGEDDDVQYSDDGDDAEIDRKKIRFDDV